VPVVATANTYATWEQETYAGLEAAPTYGVLEGARLQITRTLPSSGTLQAGRLLQLQVGGTLGSSGALPKQARYQLAGTLGSSGIVLLRKVFIRLFAGTLGSSGVLAFISHRPVALEGRLWLFGELRLHVQRHPPVFIPTDSPDADAFGRVAAAAAPLFDPAPLPGALVLTVGFRRNAPALARGTPSGAPPLVPVP
jgi:hypothetical protein